MQVEIFNVSDSTPLMLDGVSTTVAALANLDPSEQVVVSSVGLGSSIIIAEAGRVTGADASASTTVLTKSEAAASRRSTIAAVVAGTTLLRG